MARNERAYLLCSAPGEPAVSAPHGWLVSFEADAVVLSRTGQQVVIGGAGVSLPAGVGQPVEAFARSLHRLLTGTRR